MTVANSLAAMPHFFLDVVTDNRCLEDPDGEHLGSVDLARAEARLAIRELVANDIREGRRLGLERRIDIRDEQGRVVASVAFSDAVPM
jgi:hypothetical protein